MSGRILVVDDEKNIRRTLQLVLEGEGYEVEEAPSGEQALGILDDELMDLIILDVKLPGIDGIEVLRRMRGAGGDLADVPVLMISGHSSVNEAVQAVRLGATDFFEKPLDRDRILITVANCLKHRRLASEVVQLRAEVTERHEMISGSAAMQKLMAEIEKVAPTKGRVLITGESGSGKELVARAIHNLSQRSDRPFIKVNCAAIPSELIESELFGYEKGAFTGAAGRKKGQFELAESGTLFLDEIGDMSANAQAKVLRALQSGEITRIGGDRTVTVDVRVLAATNRNLEEEVSEGRFREDLYFRLNVVPLHVPPLREHLDDIPRLVNMFVERFCTENGFRKKEINTDVIDRLMQYDWPGNVRELKNLVERMVIMSGTSITSVDLPADMGGVQLREKAKPEVGLLDLFPDAPPTLKEFREEAERRFIVETLRKFDWNVSRASTELGVERTNLHKKIKSLGISREDGEG